MHSSEQPGAELPEQLVAEIEQASAAADTHAALCPGQRAPLGCQCADPLGLP